MEDIAVNPSEDEKSYQTASDIRYILEWPGGKQRLHLDNVASHVDRPNSN